MRICSIDECDRKHYGRGFCQNHYNAWWRTGNATVYGRRQVKKSCSVEGCARPFSGRGFCKLHWARWNKHGDPLRGRKDGGINPEGYKYVTREGRRIFEHRWIMEQHLGRSLYPNENVHHINGNRLDNHLQNLELWVSSQPPGQRVEDLVSWAKEILDLYDSGGYS